MRYEIMENNSKVYRIYVEKKAEFAVEANHIFQNLRTNLEINSIKSVRLINRYDAQGIDDEIFAAATPTIFAEPPVDNIYMELPTVENGELFAVEYLPGQFDQRADSCAQSIQLLTSADRPLVRSAKVYVIEGSVTAEEMAKIKAYLINPVEAREASLETVDSLMDNFPVPEDVEVLTAFNTLDKAGLKAFIADYGLAMDFDDISFCQQYFQSEDKAPTITEIKMIDTYWSDHCRHTTFATELMNPEITPDYIKGSYDKYIKIKADLGREAKPVCLMDLATVAVRYLKAEGIMKDLDESEEINACSVKIKVDIDGNEEDWLLMFKNETHNHPTEIEPFGGAATCLGGAIRDPLSGRVYVYQAMRVTGAANPLAPTSETLAGKLPQKKLVQTAAAGYSSYGNQIGLATGFVEEIYHEGYVAKRMEIGAVVGAAPAENVVRERPEAGDIIILLGGSTGRDGCGGATGSSKSHTLESLESCGAEVQKGNPPEERKIQRLFRNPEVTKLIRRCNDFGAGGVSVAIGELADGLMIDLDQVPKKYEGLDGTELAISESQERMAVVIRPEHKEIFLAAAQKENLQAVKVADVTEVARLKMTWRGKTIVDLSREFLDSNGAPKKTEVAILTDNKDAIDYKFAVDGENFTEKFTNCLSDLNVCSQKGLVERFDSSIGAGTVTMPFGGKNQLTPTPFMAAKIPVLTGTTETSSVMAYGFNPFISKISPYHGATLAVVDSVAKLVAAGLNHENLWLTFQEYFEKLRDDATRWGKPMAALLGAFEAQVNLGLGAIGGKDSMSGSFEDIDVPPTLVSFAIGVQNASKVVTPEFKAAGNNVYLFKPAYDENKLPDYTSLKANFAEIHQLMNDGKIQSAQALNMAGVAEAIAKMSMGNKIGFEFAQNFNAETLFDQCYGAILVETQEKLDIETLDAELLGTTMATAEIKIAGETMSINQLIAAWTNTLEPVYPTFAEAAGIATPVNFDVRSTLKPATSIAKPRVLIPVFPGTNCEYDTARQFERFGAVVDTFVIGNLNSNMVEESVQSLEKLIKQSQIVMFPGGFSGGDEPEGSGKFIATFFRNPRLKEALMELLNNRDGLMLGICNGFQALVKLGLLPYGEIRPMADNSPTLTFNNIGRHQSMLVNTRIASVKTPWLANCNLGDIHSIAISHGEGKFVADKAHYDQLLANGQICTQYVDMDGNPTMATPFNPNGSVNAIEGICSTDGRIFGKMGHSERVGNNIYKNVAGEKDQLLFKAGVDYFKM